MKILLIRPPVPPHTIGLKHIMICEPLELEYVAANLQNHDVQILDLIVERGLEKRLRQFKPDVVASSCYITGVNEVIKIFRKTKLWNRNCFTIAGGVHASQNPEDFADVAVDCIVRGDGTTILPEVINAIENGESLYNIPGLAIPVGLRKVELTGDRAYMPKADDLPLPRRELVSHLQHKYYYLLHQPVATMKTTWGCWYKCNFCYTWKITDGNPYSRSPESIIEELEKIEADEVYIVDDIFLINRSRLSKLASMIRNRGIKKNYLVYARADFIAQNEDVIAEWSELGLSAVFIGLEAATNTELDSMNKECTVDFNYRAVEVLRKYKVDTYGSLIPNPDYMPADWERLWKFIEDTGLYYVNISPLTPMPGTEIWNDYKDEVIVPREAHGLWDLSHVVLPTKMPLKDYYRSLLRLYSRTILNLSRANKVTQRTLPSIWSIRYFRMLLGALKIGWQFYNAHNHHSPHQLKRAMDRGPDVDGLKYSDKFTNNIFKKSEEHYFVKMDFQKFKIENPFDDLFDEHPDFAPVKDSILDIRKSHRWFDTITGVVNADLYNYQPTVTAVTPPYVIVDEKKYILFSGYDYLGLIGHPEIENAAIEAIKKFGTGTGGVRLLAGTNSIHRELEHELATIKGTEAAITFTSGYLANLAVISAVIGSKGKVFADERIHRSIVDALTLAGSDFSFFKHNNIESLEGLLEEHRHIGRKFIITEGVFSMDGDICPLPEIIILKKKYGAFLIVDEAHSFGVLGKTGRGIDEHFDISDSSIDIFTGSLSKAIPANGGFVASSREMIVYLQHEGAGFVFSGSLCPPATAAAIAALRLIKKDKWRLEKLAKNSVLLQNVVMKSKFETTDSKSPIVPLIVGNDHDTYKVVKFLKDKSMLASPVAFPAVPSNKSRIRFCATVNHDREMYDSLSTALNQYSPSSERIGLNIGAEY